MGIIHCYKHESASFAEAFRSICDKLSLLQKTSVLVFPVTENKIAGEDSATYLEDLYRTLKCSEFIRKPAEIIFCVTDDSEFDQVFSAWQESLLKVSYTHGGARPKDIVVKGGDRFNEDCLDLKPTGSIQFGENIAIVDRGPCGDTSLLEPVSVSDKEQYQSKSKRRRKSKKGKSIKTGGFDSESESKKLLKVCEIKNGTTRPLSAKPELVAENRSSEKGLEGLKWDLSEEDTIVPTEEGKGSEKKTSLKKEPTPKKKQLSAKPELVAENRSSEKSSEKVLSKEETIVLTEEGNSSKQEAALKKKLTPEKKQLSAKVKQALSDLKNNLKLKKSEQLGKELQELTVCLIGNVTDCQLLTVDDIKAITYAYHRLIISSTEGRLSDGSMISISLYRHSSILIWSILSVHLIDGADLDKVKILVELIKEVIKANKKINAQSCCNVDVLLRILPYLNSVSLDLMVDIASVIAKMEYTSISHDTKPEVEEVSGKVDDASVPVERRMLDAFWENIKIRIRQDDSGDSVNSKIRCCENFSQPLTHAQLRGLYTGDETLPILLQLNREKDKLIAKADEKIGDYIASENKRLEQERQDRKQRELDLEKRASNIINERFQENDDDQSDNEEMAVSASASSKEEESIQEPEKMYYEAFRLFRDNKVNESSELYEKIMRTFPDSPYYFLAKMAVIEIRMSSPDFKAMSGTVEHQKETVLTILEDFNRAIESGQSPRATANEVEDTTGEVIALADKVAPKVKDDFTEQQEIINQLSVMLLETTKAGKQLPDDILIFHIEFMINGQQKSRDLNDSLILTLKMIRQAIDARKKWLTQLKKGRKGANSQDGISKQKRVKQQLRESADVLLGRVEESERKLYTLQHSCDDVHNKTIALKLAMSQMSNSSP